MPSACEAMPMRPPSSVAIATLKPLPTRPEHVLWSELDVLEEHRARVRGVDAQLLVVRRQGEAGLLGGERRRRCASPCRPRAR